MNFIKESADKKPIVDTVFAIVEKAKQAKKEVGEENVVDATIGSLYDEAGKFVAYQTVFDHYDQLSAQTKGAYAASFRGNPSYIQRVYEWTLQQAQSQLYHRVIATPGGTGAVSIVLSDILEINETLILPDIAWGSYALMAKDKGLHILQYEMFEENHFNIQSLKNCVNALLGKQNRICLVINDPCHNPTGYSMTQQEWEEVIAFLNEASKTTPIVLLNDIAYIDYSYDLAHSRDYMKNFDAISENVLVVIAFSCSKTMTSYGLRCGAAVICGKEKQSVEEAEIVLEKSARAIWSNIPNAAMENFTEVTTQKLDEFLNEKQYYIDLLQERSNIFIQEAKACGLALYPYKEGFFVTIQVSDNELKNSYHEALMKNHIYTVSVSKGIRVAICSLSREKAKGLAKKMKEILEEVINGKI